MMHLVLSLAAMRNAKTSHFNARVTDTERKTGFPAEHKNPQRKRKVECWKYLTISECFKRDFTKASLPQPSPKR